MLAFCVALGHRFGRENLSFPSVSDSWGEEGGFVLPGMLLSHGLVLPMQGNPTQTVSFGVLHGLLPFKTKRAKFLGHEDV